MVLGIGLFLFLQDQRIDTNEVTEETLAPAGIEYVSEGTILRVVNREDLALAEYAIEDFNVWAEDNWNQFFEVKPTFGEIRETSFSDFGWFDRTAALSPGRDRLAFSVHDYAVATSMSFVGVIELSSHFMGLVGDESLGDIEEIIWSPTGGHIAYILNSARARGDGLSVDNMSTLRKEFSLDGRDILEALDLTEEVSFPEFLPMFDDLVWVTSGSLEFTTISPTEEETTIRWAISSDGSNLRQVQ